MSALRPQQVPALSRCLMIIRRFGSNQVDVQVKILVENYGYGEYGVISEVLYPQGVSMDTIVI